MKENLGLPQRLSLCSHTAWAPRAHFPALKQKLGGEFETLPDKSQSPTMGYDFHGGHFCLVCFVSCTENSLLILFHDKTVWLFLEANLSPQTIYDIYRQDFFEIGFLVAQAGFQHTM